MVQNGSWVYFEFFGDFLECQIVGTHFFDFLELGGGEFFHGGLDEGLR